MWERAFEGALALGGLAGVEYGLTHKMTKVVCATHAGASPGTQMGQCVNRSVIAVGLHYGLPMLVCAGVLGALVVGAKVLAQSRARR